jgi:hypothetical protein
MSNTKFNLPVATLSYPHLAKPDNKFSEDNPKYKCNLIFDKGTDLSELENAIKNCTSKKKVDVSHIIGQDDDGRPTVSPRSKFKVGCYNKAKVKLAQDEIEDVFYPGCKVIAQVSVYGHSFGVSVGLSNILFADDGEKLGGGSNPFGAPEESESGDNDGFPA